MSETSPDPEDPGAGPGREPITRMPRWVKVLVVIAIVLVLVFIILHLTGLGPTGPHNVR